MYQKGKLADTFSNWGIVMLIQLELNLHSISIGLYS